MSRWLWLPDTGRPRRPLSIRASTASWSMRFSLRTMISGAISSISLLSRLFRLITLRYRSFRSLVANRPPSSCTIGRSSGGRTGRVVRTIQSGLFPLLRKDSMTRRRLIAFLRRCPEVDCISSCSPSRTASRSTPFSTFSTASAPIPALKMPEDWSRSSLNRVSVRSWPTYKPSRSSIWVITSFSKLDLPSSNCAWSFAISV